MEQEIIEGNEIIRVFMGKEKDKSGIKTSSDFGETWQESYYDESYHKDWNLLMPVVAKFNECANPHTKALTLTIAGTHLRHIHNALADVNIKSAWIAVVEAISWYNTVKQ